MSHICDWFTSNSLLNPSKTEVFLVGPHALSSFYDFNIFDMALLPSTTVSILGVLLDTNLCYDFSYIQDQEESAFFNALLVSYPSFFNV